MDMVERMRAAIRQPFPEPMTWTSLGLVVGFLMVVTVGWRQVINYIGIKE